MTAVVYRAFDVDGLLLYVGCTNNVATRMNAHRKGSAWFQYMDHFTTEGPFERAEAERRESEAIRTEAPWFNATAETYGAVSSWRGPYLRAIYAGKSTTEARNLADAEFGGPCPDTEWRHARYLAHCVEVPV